MFCFILVRSCLTCAVTRYFFYATEGRKSDEEYDLDDNEAATVGGEFAASPTSSQTEPEDEGMDEDAVEVKVQEKTEVKAEDEPAEENDPSLADWFKVESKDVQPNKGKRKATARDDASDTESETEPESDNDDMREDDDVPIDEKDLDDEWLEIPAFSTVSCTAVICPPASSVYLRQAETNTQLSQTLQSEEAMQDFVDVKMGENESATEYDQDLIFTHL